MRVSFPEAPVVPLLLPMGSSLSHTEGVRHHPQQREAHAQVALSSMQRVHTRDPYCRNSMTLPGERSIPEDHGDFFSSLVKGDLTLGHDASYSRNHDDNPRHGSGVTTRWSSQQFSPYSCLEPGSVDGTHGSVNHSSRYRQPAHLAVRPQRLGSTVRSAHGERLTTGRQTVRAETTFVASAPDAIHNESTPIHRSHYSADPLTSSLASFVGLPPRRAVPLQESCPSSAWQPDMSQSSHQSVVCSPSCSSMNTFLQTPSSGPPPEYGAAIMTSPYPSLVSGTPSPSPPAPQPAAAPHRSFSQARSTTDASHLSLLRPSPFFSNSRGLRSVFPSSSSSSAASIAAPCIDIDGDPKLRPKDYNLRDQAKTQRDERVYDHRQMQSLPSSRQCCNESMPSEQEPHRSSSSSSTSRRSGMGPIDETPVARERAHTMRSKSIWSHNRRRADAVPCAAEVLMEQNVRAAAPTSPTSSSLSEAQPRSSPSRKAKRKIRTSGSEVLSLPTSRVQPASSTAPLRSGHSAPSFSSSFSRDLPLAPLHVRDPTGFPLRREQSPPVTTRSTVRNRSQPSTVCRRAPPQLLSSSQGSPPSQARPSPSTSPIRVGENRMSTQRCRRCEMRVPLDQRQDHALAHHLQEEEAQSRLEEQARVLPSQLGLQYRAGDVFCALLAAQQNFYAAGIQSVSSSSISTPHHSPAHTALTSSGPFVDPFNALVRQLQMSGAFMVALQHEEHSRGTPLEVIQTFPTFTFTPSGERGNVKEAAHRHYEDSCVVCLESYSASDKLRRLPCMHTFHVLCIDKWLKKSSVCPVCKVKVFSE